MTSEELKKYKEKLLKLTNEQKLKRDLELKEKAIKNMNESLTGYASIDKPWLKYYSNDKILEEPNHMTCYEELLHYNKDNFNDIALVYFGRKITYSELFDNIDKTAKSLTNIGVKKGDIVTICSITTPEIIYSFYALNKIGAISNMIDLRYTKQSIQSYLNEAKSRVMITLDLCYPKIKELVNKTDLENIITINPANSTPIPMKAVAKITKKTKIPKEEYKYIEWDKFIEKGKNTQYKTNKYVKDQPAVIVHTGGTTGIPKGVVLSNDNLNYSLLQIKNSNVQADRNYKFLNIMPPFIAYGIVLGLYCPITLGWKTTIIPQFDANKFDELIKKHKPNGIMGVPSYWETVMKSKKITNKDLQNIKDILLGGDFIKEEFEIKLEKYLKEHNCNATIEKGYSETEASANATFSSKHVNKYGSVGIPLVKTIVAAYDTEKNEELPLGEVGEITIKTPTMMLGYYENETATKNVIKNTDDGQILFTGDLGYVDKDGFVFIKDRIKRIIPRSGFKVFPSELENLFLKNTKIEECVVVGIPDEKDVNAPKAHIIIKNKYKGYEETIKEELTLMFKNSTLPPYFEPIDYKFRDEMPLTPIGKVDYQALIKEESDIKVLKKK